MTKQKIIGGLWALRSVVSYSLLLYLILYFVGALNFLAVFNRYVGMLTICFFHLVVQGVFLAAFMGLTRVLPKDLKVFSKNVSVFVITIIIWGYLSQLMLAYLLSFTWIALDLNIFWQVVIGFVSVCQFILGIDRNLLHKIKTTS